MPWERAEHAAQFLGGTDPAEDGGAAARSPQIGCQCEGHGQQRATGDALDQPTDHQHREIRGHGGHHGSGGEHREAELQDQLSPESVG